MCFLPHEKGVCVFYLMRRVGVFSASREGWMCFLPHEKGVCVFYLMRRVGVFSAS